MAGDYQPGDPLREVQLAKELGVSRGPVRDALLQLSQEGLLVYRPNSGVRVGQPPSDQTRELIVTLRRQIEVFAIENAFEQYTEEHRKEWDRALDRMFIACKNNDAAEIVLADVAFHEAILKASNQPDLVPIWTQLCAAMRFTYTRLENSLAIYAEHEAIIQAYDQKDKASMIKRIEENLI